MKKPINILVADNLKIVRDGICAMLKETPNYKICGEAQSASQLLDLLTKQQADLMIVDMEILNTSEVDLLNQIRKDYPNTKILVLSSTFGRSHLKKIVDAQIAGYILKKSGKKVLLEAIKTIIKGKEYYGSEITEQVIKNYIGSDLSKNNQKNPNALTPREKEVLDFICQEFTNQEIAEKLHISVRTVDAHRRNLLQKTGARNTAGLVRYAIEHDLV